MLRDILVPLEDELSERFSNDPPRLAMFARKLSFFFTSERDNLSSDYLSDPDLFDAYMAAFLLPNAVKVAHCLLQIDEAGLIRPRDRLDVLDVGVGPGTAALAASLFFSKKCPETQVSVAGFEQSRRALACAQALFSKIAPPHHSFKPHAFSLKKDNIKKLPFAHRFDIIIAANILSESSVSDFSYELCCDLVTRRLSPHGAIIIIEPALCETARPLMRLRDRLISGGIAAVVAPCLHNAFCPMLKANERDWCHFYIDWKPPAYLSALDRLSGMRHEHLKLAYLILKPSCHGKPCAGPPNLWRAVSSPLRSKGKCEMLLCGACGEIKKTRRLNKDASAVNSDFDKITRGDVASYGGSERICKGDAFSIVSKWTTAKPL